MIPVVFLLCFLAFSAVAQPDVKILRQEGEVHPDGSFHWSYEAENGITAEAEGVVREVGAEEPALEVQGSFQYVAPDGTPISLTYVANEGGFQPQGDHLPTPPPIPDAIRRALEYIASQPKPAPNKPYRPFDI